MTEEREAMEKKLTLTPGATGHQPLQGPHQTQRPAACTQQRRIQAHARHASRGRGALGGADGIGVLALAGAEGGEGSGARAVRIVSGWNCERLGLAGVFEQKWLEVAVEWRV